MKIDWKKSKRTRSMKKQLNSQSNSKVVFTSIAKNEQYINNYFHHSNDVVMDRISIQHHPASVIYLGSLIDLEKLEDKILVPMSFMELEDIGSIKYFDKYQYFEECFPALLNGYALLFLDDDTVVYGVQAAASNKRSITEPESEKVVKGAHEGFVESLSVNLNLIRNHLKNRNLVIQYLPVDTDVKSEICIVYMKNLANEDIVKEVEKRVSAIQSDTVLTAGDIEEFLEDNTFSPFPQMLNTERPDRVIANVMEGRIALLVNGSTTSFIFPVSFFAFYQSPDDYNLRWIAGTFIRFIRLFSFMIAVSLPALYIAVIGFHFEVLPDDLVLPIKRSVENVPYPPLIEAFIMELTIELIREAGIRLPTSIGQTIGIVGGLVIGDAIVKAGLVSNTMIVVVAITAISAYVVPSDEMSTAVRLIRFPMMLAAAFLGFVGIIFGFMILLIHLCKLESFGRAFLAPLAPLNFNDLKDTLIRVPLWKMKNRPKDTNPKKSKRLSKGKGWKKK
ncbi:spore germination protein [Rossellomorea sp. BNER]|uniref:spore germination protein n=1 Tax=Rossellomorea sp. BNER TaxID=2962031 RepID=UPI003AF2D212|nr:spore germination protein [Rossellomorea sp. BNER]